MKPNHLSYEVVTRPCGPHNMKATDGRTKHFATKNLLEDDKKKIDTSIVFLKRLGGKNGFHFLFELL